MKRQAVINGDIRATDYLNQVGTCGICFVPAQTFDNPVIPTQMPLPDDSAYNVPTLDQFMTDKPNSTGWVNPGPDNGLNYIQPAGTGNANGLMQITTDTSAPAWSPDAAALTTCQMTCLDNSVSKAVKCSPLIKELAAGAGAVGAGAAALLGKKSTASGAIGTQVNVGTPGANAATGGQNAGNKSAANVASSIVPILIGVTALTVVITIFAVVLKKKKTAAKA